MAASTDCTYNLSTTASSANNTFSRKRQRLATEFPARTGGADSAAPGQVPIAPKPSAKGKTPRSPELHTLQVASRDNGEALQGDSYSPSSSDMELAGQLSMLKGWGDGDVDQLDFMMLPVEPSLMDGVDPLGGVQKGK